MSRWLEWLVYLVLLVFTAVVILIVQSPPAPIPLAKVESRPSSKMCSRGEAACRRVLERHYGKLFPNVRPAWLINPETGRRLELDCYNEELKLAVEYNGIQHYVWPNFTNQSRSTFISQLRRDRLKRDLCVVHGVDLLVVPYTVPLIEIPNHLLLRLRMLKR
jgi:hypothetical protein